MKKQNEEKFISIISNDNLTSTSTILYPWNHDKYLMINDWVILYKIEGARQQFVIQNTNH